MTQDLPYVYRAASIGEADIVAAWLEEQGIAAFVKDRGMVGLYGPIAMSPLGIEVCVANSEVAVRAAELLREHAADVEAQKGPPVKDTIDVVCEACGATTSFPNEQRGRVESCPKCRAFVDVPDDAVP
jgi:hypothetical protein